ncbi:hypothetical protein MKX03_021862 [Papaver bracteatum]|nr:hypothetical protein MKX03_021862 [Papaver bracteatum]
MGQGTPGGLNKQGGGAPGGNDGDNKKKEKKFEPPPPPTRIGRKQRKQRGSETAAARLPAVKPLTKCKLRLLKLERIQDYLLMEEEFVSNQERLKPQEDKNQEDRSKVDDLRGSPMSVGSLEELIDDNHAIVSSSMGPEYYVGIMSFVDKYQLEPGCAILMHNKAVANSTSATFLRVVGSELIQKYLGDGPKLVRYDAHSGGECEIQRTMLELLNQLDGFDSRGDVKVILATNRIESLDPALLRPGHIDRKIEFPLPDTKTRRRIFQIHTSRMTLADDVNLEEFVMTKDEFSGADIKVTHPDFKKAKEKVMYKKKEGVPEGLYM